MAVTSSSSNFNVVLSFSEEHACKTFAGRLCSALKHKGASTFSDEASRARRGIDVSLANAVQNSAVCIPIVSESYTKSRWCMMGLTKMVESSKTIVPVFYAVDPFDAKHLKGPFEAVFQEHMQNLSEKKVVEWKKALREVAEVKGCSVLTVVTDGWRDAAEMSSLIALTSGLN